MVWGPHRRRAAMVVGQVKGEATCSEPVVEEAMGDSMLTCARGAPDAWGGPWEGNGERSRVKAICHVREEAAFHTASTAGDASSREKMLGNRHEDTKQTGTPPPTLSMDRLARAEGRAATSGAVVPGDGHGTVGSGRGTQMRC